MIGQKQIIEARRQGYKPSAIFFQVGFALPEFASRFEQPENALATKQYPEVWIEPNEVGSRLDLRFAVGCRSLVHGRAWSEGFLALIERLAELDPLQVVAVTDENADLMIWEHGEWTGYAFPA